MSLAPIQSSKFTTTVLTPSGIPVAQRIALPSAGENAVRLYWEGAASATAIYVLFGDASVTATNSTGMLFKQTDLPSVVRVPPSATHFSVVTGNGTVTVNVTFGIEV